MSIRNTKYLKKVHNKLNKFFDNVKKLLGVLIK